MKSTTGKPKLFYGYIIIAAAFLMSLIVYGIQYSFGVFFKPILEEFDWPRALVSGAYSISWLVMGLSAIIMGWLTDRYGPRIVISGCGVIAGAGFMLMSVITNVWQLYIVYGFIIGGGISIWIPLMSTVTRWFLKRRTIMSGIVAAGIGIGTLTSSPVASSLISALGWRSTYLIFGCVLMVAVVGSAQLLRRDPEHAGLIAYGTELQTGEVTSPVPVSINLRRAVHMRQFWLVFLILICFGLCIQSMLAHLVPHITDLGADPSSAAVSIAIIGGMSIISKVAFGALGDRIGNRNILIISFIILLLALLWLLPATELWQFYLFAVIFGFAYGGHVAQHSPIVGEIFGVASHGVIFSIVGLGTSIGSTIGPVMAGYIFDVTDSYQAAFMIMAGVSIAGLLFTALIPGRNSEMTNPLD